MKAESWQQIDELFQAAVELEAADQAAFLDIACAGDRILRSEIEALLTADSREWDFIERPAFESAAILLEEEQPRLTPGKRVGHYEILRLIGKGGMGEVYLARDLVLNRKIALKLLPLDYTDDENRLRRFQREAQTVSALNHPNIITIHEFGSVNEQQFIATELIEGETLRQHIRRGPLTLLEALEIAIQTAGALAAAHRAGIIHRDIKPENIMLRPDGYVKILDFGLAKLAERSEPDPRPAPSERTDVSSGLLLGTLRYMSPEQAGGLPVDSRSDIFSLGVVLYEMITGRPPFDDKDPHKLAESIWKDDPSALGTCTGAVPDVLAAVIARMLSKDRVRRYLLTDELITDLKLVKEELALELKSSDRARVTPAPAQTFRRTISQTEASPRTIGLIIILALTLGTGYLSYKLLGSPKAAASAVKSLKEMGTWVTKAPISSPRWQAEPAVLNGVLYVAGGWKECTPFANLESYDPATNTWTQRASMHTARGGHGVGVLDGQLYAVGGSTDCGHYIASVEAYEPTSNTWSIKASLPRPRSGHVVAVANGKLYAIGGKATGNGHLGLNTQYDPQSDTWIERAPMPTARSGAAVAVLQGIIYVIGGGNDSGGLATVEAYDPTTDSWTSKQSMPAPRNGLAVAELDGIIYAFGGSRNRAQVEAYDPTRNTWTVVAQMPTPRSNVHAAALGGSIYFAGGTGRDPYLSSVIAFTPELATAPKTEACLKLQTTTKAPIPTARSNMALGGINGIIYAAGGFEDTSGFSTINEAYDPSTDRWTERAPMPVAREMRGSNNAVIGGKLYVIGGNARGECTNLNQAYDPKTDSWTTKAPMPTPRCHMAVVALNGLIYALGGTNTNGSIRYATVEIYNPSTDTWTTAPGMPTGRQDLGAAALNGTLYAVGGWNSALSPGQLDVLEAYDPISETWSTKAPMPTPRSGIGAGVLNGLLVVVGGENDEVALGTVEAYDPNSNTWTTLTNMPTARTFLSTVAMDNTLYAIGGRTAPSSPISLTTNETFNILPCTN
jgi:serine/threonine protein kinase